MEKIPLILIPGLLCDPVLWDHQTASLAPVAHCTVTHEHMNHDTIQQMAQAVVAGAPSRFALAGLSMGGYIALEICRLFGERVDRLALIDTSARADTFDQTDRRKALMARCEKGGFHGVVETLYPLLVHPDRETDSELKRRVTDMALRVGPEIFVRQQWAIINRIDQVPNLEKISCPTFIVCGEKDRITPVECATEMAFHVKGSELKIIPDCGHMSTMEKPDKLSEIMRQWLLSDRERQGDN